MVNSRYPLPSATPLSFGREALHLTEAHLLPKLRWQFAEFLNYGSLKRLGILYPSTCVGLRYGQQCDSLRGFSWKHGINHFPRSENRSRHRISALNGAADLPTAPAYVLKPGFPTPGWPTLLRPPFAQTSHCWCRNINRLSIAYAFRPRLRYRLTLRRLPLPRKPWIYGERVSHPFYRYSCLHAHFQNLQVPLRSPFAGDWNAPLPAVILETKITAPRLRCRA